MKTTLHITATLFVLAALTVACTSGGATEGVGSSGAGTLTSSPTATFTGPPGSIVYGYTNTGLTATMQLEGTKGTLTIQNATGHELPPPDFYILDARDGKRIEGTVAAAAAVADGAEETFDVSFSGIEDKNIGLVVLLMGTDNYGAFTRQ